MPDKTIISHRGEKYEIGSGKRFYGIWVVGAPHDAPIDRWPQTRDGWEQAWARFVAIERPATIVAVSRQRGAAWPRLGRGGLASGGEKKPAGQPGGIALLAGEGLLVLGVVGGLAGLFPAYYGGSSLLSQGYQTVSHLAYVVAWAISAGLIALGVARPGTARLGALFGLGTSAVTFGLFLADLGEVISGGQSLGTGLVISLAGWAACTSGAALALAAARHEEPRNVLPGLAWPARTGPGWPGEAGRRAGPFALLLLAGIGTAMAFAPSWDSYTLTSSLTGATSTITAGYAFANPGLVIAGNVAVMVAVAVVAVAAVAWRHAREGALLLAGAVVPLAAEAVAALIQVGVPATPSMFGISQAQAAAMGLTITSGVTPIFWVFCVFVFSLIVSVGWLFTAPGHPAAMVPVPAPWSPTDNEDVATMNETGGRDAVRDDPAEREKPGGEAPGSDDRERTDG